MRNVERSAVLRRTAEFLGAGRLDTLRHQGIDLVMGRSEGYFLHDLDGRRLIDFHLQGGVYNLGHRNAELVEVMRRALDSDDLGHARLPSPARAALGEALARSMPGGLRHSIFSSSGAEAVNVALQCARRATGRKKTVSLQHAARGRAEERSFNHVSRSESARVPFNDLEAMADALSAGDVAGVLLETMPAAMGFPLPAPDYLAEVAALCARQGSLLIVDESQTGLGRTGRMWSVEGWGIEPDILVTAKGLSGGLFPIAATVLNPRAAECTHEQDVAPVSTFGGADLGCRVAEKVLEMTQLREVLGSVSTIGSYLEAGLRDIQQRYPHFLVDIRRNGLVMALEFDHPRGGACMSKALFDHGVLAIWAEEDPRVLPFSPGLLLDKALCDEVISCFEDALGVCLQHLP